MDILKESFNWVFNDMRKTVVFMFFSVLIFSVLETFFITSTFNTGGASASQISQESIMFLSVIQNIKVLIITGFLCVFISKAISANLGFWGQIKAQFHAFFFGVFIALILAMASGSLINVLFGDATLEVQIFGITVLFGLFMIMGYWHYYIMYSVRRKMQHSGIRYGLLVMLKDILSIFKHWNYVVGFTAMSLLVMVVSLSANAGISAFAENAYISSLLQSIFYPLSAVILTWYAKGVYYHYAKP